MHDDLEQVQLNQPSSSAINLTRENEVSFQGWKLEPENKSSFSWLDALVFSDEADPFHDDWPYWGHKESSLSTAEL